METYCINKQAQANGDHEVHNLSVGRGCLPAAHNRVPLGQHPTCQSAVASAQRANPTLRINGCYYCATACHTS